MSLVLPAREALVSEVPNHLVDPLLPPAFGAVDLDQQTTDALRPFPGRLHDLPLGPFDVHLDEVGTASEEVGQFVERTSLDGPIA